MYYKIEYLTECFPHFNNTIHCFSYHLNKIKNYKFNKEINHQYVD